MPSTIFKGFQATIFLFLNFYLLLERGEVREKGKESNTTGYPTGNPGMGPDRESNQ